MINPLCLISALFWASYGLASSAGTPTIAIEKPTRHTVVLPTNAALLHPEHGGAVLRYQVEFFRGLPSLLYFSDLWISLRPAGDDGRGVFHFVYKGQQPPDVEAAEQRLISGPVDAGAVTFIINYSNGRYTLHINGDRVPGEIHIPFPLAGGAIRTFSRGQQSDIIPSTSPIWQRRKHG